MAIVRFYFLCCAEKVDLVALFERHVSLLPIGATSHVLADAPHFAEITGHTNLHDLYFEKRFDCLFDFDLVGIGPNLEQHLVGALGQEGALFRDQWRSDYIVQAFHATHLSSSRFSAGSVRTKCS